MESGLAIPITLILICSIVFFSGCTQPTEGEAPVGEEQMTEAERQANALLQRAVQEKDPTICANIEQKGIKGRCFSSTASYITGQIIHVNGGLYM